VGPAEEEAETGGTCCRNTHCGRSSITTAALSPRTAASTMLRAASYGMSADGSALAPPIPRSWFEVE
jgi:hypothetical protein